MLKLAGIVIVSLWLTAQPVAAQDMREPTSRTPAERTFILGQMRLFLASVQTMSTDLSTGDMKAVATEAAARGRKGTPLSEIPAGLKAKETANWSAMMGGVRKGFDDIATAAASGASPIQVLGMMGDTMRNCVACHQAYRLVVE